MIYSFRVDILKDYVKAGEALARDCTIKFDETAEVTRGIQFDMSLDHIKMSSISFDRFTQRFRPVLTIDGVDFPLGVYMATTTPETLSPTGSYMQVEGYDETMILKQAKTDRRTYYPAGTLYFDVINDLMAQCGLVNIIAESNALTLANDREYELGTTYLSIINELCDEMNYEHVYADLSGYFHFARKVDRTTADTAYTDVKQLRMIKPIKRNTDIYELPNVIVGVVSNPDRSKMMYRAENNNLASAISIPRRGYKIVQVLKLDNTADATTLKEYVDRMLLNAMQTTEVVEFDTMAEGGHEYGYMVSVDTALLEGLYRETGYTIKIGRTARMTHRLERKLYV